MVARYDKPRHPATKLPPASPPSANGSTPAAQTRLRLSRFIRALDRVAHRAQARVEGGLARPLFLEGQTWPAFRIVQAMPQRAGSPARGGPAAPYRPAPGCWHAPGRSGHPDAAQPVIGEIGCKKAAQRAYLRI
jgi:hypothetical protein